jgi:uracil-DNA glycosylase family 4
MNGETPGQLLDRARNLLLWYQRIGCRGFDGDAADREALCNLGRCVAGGRATETLDDIRRHLGDCRRCGLHRGRNRVVFGEGHPHARLMLIGEGPGQEEDRRGRPFVGAAGKLLTRIIEAMQLSREEVYIANIVKCRPPGNRGPAREEIQACRPFLHRQIRAVGPAFIIALGSFAAKELLTTDRPISRLRGRFHQLGDIAVMPTYHPAYLLRNPEQKRAVWKDVQQVMAAMQRQRNGQ